MMIRLTRAVAAAITLSAVLVGVPWLLMSLAGWPLPTKMPDWSNAARMVEQGDVAGITVVKALACVVWVAWAVVAWAVIWEAVVNVPRMLRGRGHRPNPLAPATVSRGVGWLFAFVLATTSSPQTVHAAAPLAGFQGIEGLDAPTIGLVVDESDVSESVDDDLVDDVAEIERTEVWVADDEDSLWSIAQRSGVGVEEVLAVNEHLVSTTMITAGMRIRLPAGVDVPDSHRSDDSTLASSTDTRAVVDVPAKRYVVRVNDGMWNVAEALLGDGSRHVEMARLAVGQEVAPGVVFTEDTFVIHPGWVFTLDQGDVALPSSSALYTVVSGDSLWSIAAEQLGDAERWPEVWDLNRDQTMIDGRIFDDPGLIRPGWQLQLVEAEPTLDEPSGEVVAEPATDEQATTTEEPHEIEPALPQDQETTRGTQPPSAVEADAPTVPVGESLPSGTPPPPPSIDLRRDTPPVSRSASTSSDTAEVSASVDSLESADPDSTWERSVWAGIAAGTLLLAGLGVMTRRLRNRRLARLEPGRRLIHPPDVAAGTELAVTRSLDRVAELTTLRGLLQSVTPYAAEQSDPPAVRAVQIGDERVEILFATPAPLPPRGWTTIDGGQSWTHRFDEEPVTSRQLLTPALVTIGIRDGDDGDEVLLDLETAASVSVGGDRDAALGLARSMALELATYPLGVPIEVCIIGMHVDGTETCDRVWLDTTLQRATRVARQRLAHIGLRGAPSIVAARAELDEDDGSHDPMVFFVDAASVATADRPLLDELVDLCQSSTGVAVVVVGDHSGTDERILVRGDGQLAWSGVELIAPNVTLRAAAEAAVMLDHAAAADSEPLEPDETMVGLLDGTVASRPAEIVAADDDRARSDCEQDLVDEVPEYEYAPPPHDVLLRVMGNVTVEGCDLTYDDVELLGVMTCLRGRTEIHIDLIQNLIAPDSVRKTVENRIGRLRKKLGVDADDIDLLPAASATGRGLNAVYEVSSLVLTDVDLLEHRLHTARGLGSTDALRVLADGLDLMRGPLFRARKGFDAWPHTEGVVQAMTSVVTNFARDLIELAAEVDDIALVVRTTACAGHVLDNPAVEAPFRQAEAEYADACGDEQLIASVECARKRLLDYLRGEDSLATS